MKSLRSLVLALAAMILTTGCFQQERLIRLNADGSGTIEETLVMSKEVAAQMKQMTQGLGALLQGSKAGGGAVPAMPGIFDEAKLREGAEKMGKGVTLTSAKPVTTEAGEGYTAVYAFTDINEVRLDQNPGDSLPGGGGQLMKLGNGKPKRETVKFEFVKGAPATLTVKLPEPKDSDLKDKPQIPAQQGDMAAMMMQQMFKDMKVTLAVEVAGKVVESNAEFRDGSRVTLMEMDFNKVLANPEKLKVLMQAQPKTIQEAKALVKGVDGIRAETQPKVTVRFQ